MTKDLTKWLAFTLAEVLITLAIIGVVAGLTIPSLLANTNEKGLNTSDSVFQRRLGEALKIMNLQGTLADQSSTKAFVDELGRHMKITKTCDENHLSECFVSEFKSGDKTIKVSDLTTSENLNKGSNYGTKTVGVVFGNGTRALIAYNPKATQDQFNNSNENGSPVRLTTTGTGKQVMVSLGTDSLSILYILQDRKNNNEYSAIGNIRGKNISFGLNSCGELVQVPKEDYPMAIPSECMGEYVMYSYAEMNENFDECWPKIKSLDIYDFCRQKGFEQGAGWSGNRDAFCCIIDARAGGPEIIDLEESDPFSGGKPPIEIIEE